MKKIEGRFRTWKSKKQWLFAGTVVTAGLLFSALASALLLGSGFGSQRVGHPDNHQVGLSGDNRGSQLPGLSGSNEGQQLPGLSGSNEGSHLSGLSGDNGGQRLSGLGGSNGGSQLPGLSG
ncbi:KxYKxGKxW signal peptide domain-containing protein [Streptococcus equi]|uniref:KxYKxGKxW signal peptide domain-containing protein n=1 Tax=Streptococcus equi TaxID=1336 RepID=UPI002659B86A|nr:KxYKxGKxW signal peptide domain-containing protein [Streptococcus equi]WKF66829.1 KxYKxGKxW signal peptide domain-containing protein [Streptococcus equi subsp. zooepidemicus]